MKKTLPILSYYILDQSFIGLEVESYFACLETLVSFGKNGSPPYLSSRIGPSRGKETKETYKLENGSELPLPKYYHDKIYTEDERENLWIIKQERGYRYIAGEKVSTDDLEEWDNLTKYYQQRLS